VQRERYAREEDKVQRKERNQGRAWRCRERL
jgi:hypothetical protein